MIEIDMIKQALVNNANKPAINQTITKKIALSKIESEIKLNYNWVVRDLIEKIAGCQLPEDEKNNLFQYLKSSIYENYDKMKKDLNDLFGVEEKQASVESETKENKEEAAQDDTKDEKKTPAEYVEEQPDAKMSFDR